MRHLRGIAEKPALKDNRVGFQTFSERVPFAANMNGNETKDKFAKWRAKLEPSWIDARSRTGIVRTTALRAPISNAWLFAGALLERNDCR